jgi:HD-GYP domain-containing protein (c-di-GMP phosphodiesterase class II)
MGEEIPIEARIVSVVDVYDALRSKRPYKEAFSHEKSIDILINGDERTKPEHFDKKILEKFIDIIEKNKDLYDKKE